MLSSQVDEIMTMLVVPTVKCVVMAVGLCSRLGEEMLKIFDGGWEI